MYRNLYARKLHTPLCVLATLLVCSSPLLAGTNSSATKESRNTLSEIGPDKDFQLPGISELVDTALGIFTDFPGNLSALIKAEATAGGDNLLDTNTVFGEVEKLNAGDFAGLAAGIQWVAGEWPIMFRATVGYKFHTIDENAGRFGFARVPWEVTAYVGTEHHKFGLGASYQDNPLLRIRSTNLNLPLDKNEKYHDATGFIAEYVFLVNDRLSVNARYVVIDYEPQSSNLKKVNGDHVGLGVGYTYF